MREYVHEHEDQLCLLIVPSTKQLVVKKLADFHAAITLEISAWKHRVAELTTEIVPDSQFSPSQFLMDESDSQSKSQSTSQGDSRADVDEGKPDVEADTSSSDEEASDDEVLSADDVPAILPPDTQTTAVPKERACKSFSQSHFLVHDHHGKNSQPN